MTISRTEIRQRFHQLAQDAEFQLSISPDSYKRKILLLGILGYAVIGVLFALILTAIGGSIWLATLGTVLLVMLIKSKLIFLLLAIVWFLFKAVWVKLTAPEGYELGKKEFPLLWQEVNALQKSLRTPTIHRIVMVPEMNAAIAQTPRLGLFGWHKNTLVVGMELLLGLSAEEGKAVIAHELGHLSGSHAKFNGWVYRIRQSWLRIDDALQQQQRPFTAPLRRFFSWYALTFSGYTFALARFNEYEADKISADIVGGPATSSALCYSRLLGEALNNEFWPTLWKAADTEPTPPADTYLQMADFLRKRRLHSEVTELEQALTELADPDDTHPSLRQRLQALKQNHPVLLSTDRSAAEALLGDKLNGLLQYYSELWQQAVSENWQQQQQNAQQANETLTQLGNVAVSDFTLEQALSWLSSIHKPIKDDRQLDTLRQLQQRFAETPDFAFVLACELMQTSNAEAKDLFISASEHFLFREDALQQLLQLAILQQDDDAKQRWQLALDNHYDHCDTLDATWNNLRPDEQVTAPELSAKELGVIQHTLAKIPALKSVLMVKRVLPEEITTPMYILFVTPHWYRSNGDSLMRKVAEQVGDKIPVFVINKDYAYKALVKNIKKLGQQVYKAS
mgnify:CR=1 FL=1